MRTFFPGWRIFFGSSNNNWLLEKKNLAQCMEQCVDGIIWYSPAREQLAIPDEKKGIPYVIVTKYPLSGYEGDQIQIDYRTAVEGAYEKMRDLGMERIGFIFDSMKFFLYASENIHSYRITNYTKIVPELSGRWNYWNARMSVCSAVRKVSGPSRTQTAWEA